MRTISKSPSRSGSSTRRIDRLRRKPIMDRKWTSKLGLYQPIFFSGKADLESLTTVQLDKARLDRDIVDFTTTLDADWESICTT